MSLYRKKPAIIEARRFAVLDGWDAVEEVAAWCGGYACRDELPMNAEKTYYWSIRIPTPEGVMTASPGDFIIKGVKGEFYPCKPDIFAETYEAAE